MARGYAYGGFLAAFLPIRDAQTALAAARASAWAAAYLALTYLAFGIGRGLALGPAGALVVGGFNLLLAAAAAALGWLAWSRRPRWVALVILAWVAAKLAGSVVDAALGGRLGGVWLPLLATLYAVAGLRGTWALAASAPPPTEVFD